MSRCNLVFYEGIEKMFFFFNSFMKKALFLSKKTNRAFRAPSEQRKEENLALYYSIFLHSLKKKKKKLCAAREQLTFTELDDYIERSCITRASLSSSLEKLNFSPLLHSVLSLLHMFPYPDWIMCQSTADTKKRRNAFHETPLWWNNGIEKTCVSELTLPVVRSWLLRGSRYRLGICFVIIT